MRGVDRQVAADEGDIWVARRAGAVQRRRRRSRCLVVDDLRVGAVGCADGEVAGVENAPGAMQAGEDRAVELDLVVGAEVPDVVSIGRAEFSKDEDVCAAVAVQLVSACAAGDDVAGCVAGDQVCAVGADAVDGIRA